jgi:hypothetical protein
MHVSIFTGWAVEVSYLLSQSQCCHKGGRVHCKSDGARHQGYRCDLGMETLARWGVRIDCAQRTVHLSAPDGQEVTVSASEPSRFLCQMEARSTDGIRVVSEFSDVFPDDLPGMPPDRELSFLLISCLAQLLLLNGPIIWHPLSMRKLRRPSTSY